MFDGFLMLRVKWTIVHTIHLKGDKFVVGVTIKATVVSSLNDSPGYPIIHLGEDRNCDRSVLVTQEHNTVTQASCLDHSIQSP